MADYVIAISRDLEKLMKRSDEVLVIGMDMKTKPEVSKTIKDLKETIYANKNLIALAAPQIGTFERIFCIRFANGDVRAFINPMISKTEGLHLVREISPSLPDRSFIVPRHDRIIAMYQTPTGRPEESRFEGVVAEIFQHMVNMLDGVLISDIGLEVDEDFDNATEEERAELLTAYLKILKDRTEEANKAIEEDEELKKTRDAIRFLEGVATGKITMEKQEELVKNKEEVIVEPVEIKPVKKTRKRPVKDA
jgi:peptide deformylase